MFKKVYNKQQVHHCNAQPLVAYCFYKMAIKMLMFNLIILDKTIILQGDIVGREI